MGSCLLGSSVQSLSCVRLQPHELQHTRPPYPSPTAGVYPNPCPLSWWCHLTVSSSVVPFSSCPQSFPASSESALHIRWPKYWILVLQMLSFKSCAKRWCWIPTAHLIQLFNISPSNEYSGLISFRMDWLDLLAVQGTLKSLLQYHSSKASILQHSAFFLYGPTLTSILDYWKHHSLE